jgi:hypothetical protein
VGAPARETAAGIKDRGRRTRSSAGGIERLIPYAKNARVHTDAQVAAIAASIKEWGWTTPALVGEDGGLIAGLARVLAARQLGIADWGIERLIPYAKNARVHTDAQVAAIAASIKEWGWTTPPPVPRIQAPTASDSMIVGDGRVRAAHLLGLDEVPCIVLAHLTPTQPPCLPRLLPAGAVAGRGLHPLEKRRLVTAHVDSGPSGLMSQRRGSTDPGRSRLRNRTAGVDPFEPFLASEHPAKSSSSGQGAQDAQPYMGGNGPAGMPIASGRERRRPLSEKRKPRRGEAGVFGRTSTGENLMSGKYLTAFSNDRHG